MNAKVNFSEISSFAWQFLVTLSSFMKNQPCCHKFFFLNKFTKIKNKKKSKKSNGMHLIICSIRYSFIANEMHKKKIIFISNKIPHKWKYGHGEAEKFIILKQWEFVASFPEMKLPKLANLPDLTKCSISTLSSKIELNNCKIPRWCLWKSN